MFAIEARKMGYRVHTFSPDSDTPTGHISDDETTASYDDLDAVHKFAQGVDVVTFEFENVSAEAVKAASESVSVHPKGGILHTTQNRFREKSFLSLNGFPVAPFRHITTIDDLQRGVAELGTPAILKTAGFGYDGKGQSKINELGEIDSAFAAIDGRESILESFVDFEKEVSVVCARGQDGSFVHYGVIENEHENHILDISFAPAIVPETIYKDAVEITRSIAEVFGYIGTMCVEFFVTKDEKLLVNEIAPRPHNSGHLTFGPCVTSQFEQQVRAVCGLPLGSTEFRRPSAMANLLGGIWQNGEPNWAAALSDPNVNLHLYGKAQPRPGRKMGHLTVSDESAVNASRKVRDARLKLKS
jgi:5-(carboxyamino)imidazole ribonucleotide synthase